MSLQFHTANLLVADLSRLHGAMPKDTPHVKAPIPSFRQLRLMCQVNTCRVWNESCMLVYPPCLILVPSPDCTIRCCIAMLIIHHPPSILPNVICGIVWHAPPTFWLFLLLIVAHGSWKVLAPHVGFWKLRLACSGARNAGPGIRG